MKLLGKERLDSILLEGGGELNWSALNAGIVSKVQAYIAPKLFGGSGKSPVGGQGVPVPAEAFMLEQCSIRHIGEDILIESRVKNVHGNN
jgi:diaminohydroxyphosphoribosylaminopyrimidine deaminase/5-amino-6-(5-phosphoribosylamino)uracil reductase